MEVVQEGGVAKEDSSEAQVASAHAFDIREVILKKLTFEMPVGSREFLAEIDAFRKSPKRDESVKPNSLMFFKQKISPA